MSFTQRATRVLAPVVLASLGGCSLSIPTVKPPMNTPSVVQPVTVGQRDLMFMPPPAQPIPVAVYSFTDQTGQLKASDTGISYSRAITQGGTSILVSALRSASNGQWFDVIEREHLDNVLRERQIIREMRRQYLNEEVTPAEVLPSLTFAGITLEGGIISFDSAVKSGGIGARFLGIGGSTQYRVNTATVYLRAVSVKTGQVLANVITQKSVSSYALSGGTFKYLTYNDLLEAEVGVAANEPTQIAVQAAVEKAVYALIIEGAKAGPKQIWSFADPAAGKAWIDRYTAERDKSLADVYHDNGGLPVSKPGK